jgi:2-keto-4-pentenoate hydratase
LTSSNEETSAGEALEELARWADACWASEFVPPEVLERSPDLSIADAYRIQLSRAAQAVDAGDRIIGYKAALTSRAMQAQAGIEEPLMGTLLRGRTYPEQAPIGLRGFRYATVEPEVAVLLGRDLAGPGATRLDAMHAISGCLPCVEIGDLRTSPAPSLQQLICFNTLNAGQVFGGPLRSLAGLDLRTEGVILSINGEVRASATGVEVLGDPLNAVVFIANKLGELGRVLKAGMICMTGSIVAGARVQPGDDVRVEFTRLGQLAVRFR